jgi:hypothetical protein
MPSYNIINSTTSISRLSKAHLPYLDNQLKISTKLLF